MSLKPSPAEPVPEETMRVAQAAFPKGNSYLTLRDELGTIFEDDDFKDLYPTRGQPALSPWRLGLVTVLQFRENLPDRQAAEAVRGRIDWKYLLGLDLTDPGFDFSVLSEFRDRLLQGEAGERLLEKLLERCEALGMVKSRGKQRTDSTNVLASIRSLNRLELMGETLRAVLNDLAVIEPNWLRSVVSSEWFQRYGRRIEDSRLPSSKAKRDTLAHTIGEDGFHLLSRIDATDAPGGLKSLGKVEILRKVWDQHFEREGDSVRYKTKRERSKASEAIESPYDDEARYRRRSGTNWTGYIVHICETCDDDSPNLLTNVMTTTASVHEARCTKQIHESLVGRRLPPGQHLVDSAYVDANLLVNSRNEFNISLIGPTRPDSSWQSKLKDGYDRTQFKVDWDNKRVHCPQGKRSRSWRELSGVYGPYVQVVFNPEKCGDCEARQLCTRSTERRLRLQPQEQYDALLDARRRHRSQEGRKLYAKRAGVEGTISQGVRSFGMRCTRYRGLAKTNLQHIATAAAINLDRLVAWIAGVPRSTTRTSHFAALRP